MKHNGGVEPEREPLASRFSKMLSTHRQRSIVAGTVIGGLIAVASGVAIAATVDNDETQQAAKRQPAVVNAPSALSPGGNPNAPLVGDPNAATPSSLAPTMTMPGAQPGIVSPSGTPNASPSSPSPTSSLSGATPTTGVTPTTTRVSPTTTSSPTTTAPTTTAVRPVERLFDVVATNGSDGFLPGDPRVAVDVNAKDNAGFITKISVNWQAGTTPEQRVYDTAECNDDSGRPTTNRAERFVHDYAEPGTYNVVVAVTSTDCDGENSRTNYETVVLTASNMAAQDDGSTSKRR